MYHIRFSWIILGFAVAILLTFQPKSVQAQYEPPRNVTLSMYSLTQPGGGMFEPPIPCIKDDPDVAGTYGCTAIAEGPNRTPPYPFASSTITISIDGIDGPDNDVYPYAYLWDLVTTELGVHLKGHDSLPNSGYVPHAAIEAQAIAARTYTYHWSFYVGTINNSPQFHAYLPYSYEALLDESQKEDVRIGVQRRLYMTESNTSYPLDAQYGADSPSRTVEGTPTLVSDTNYLRSVEEPISALEGTLNGNGIGLSSNGAKRWSYGHQFAQPGANFEQNQWSVRWDDAFQILTHYYSGIHIRDADNPSATISETPNQRWVPLWMRWNLHSSTPPTSICAGHAILLEVLVQNSGIETWPAGGSVTFEAVTNRGLQLQSAAVDGAAFPQEPVPPGGTYTATLLYQAPTNEPNGYLTQIHFGMAEGATRFSQQNKAWPDFFIEITIPHCNARAYLPLIETEAQPSIQ